MLNLDKIEINETILSRKQSVTNIIGSFVDNSQKMANAFVILL